MEHNLAAAMLALIVAAGLAVVFSLSRFASLSDLATPAVGLLFGGAFLFAGRRQRLPQYLWLALA